MTATAVACPPPSVAGSVRELVETTPLGKVELARFVAASCQDGCRAALESGGEAFVVPMKLGESIPGWGDPRDSAEELVAAALLDEEDVDILAPVTVGEGWVDDLFELVVNRSDEASVAVLSPVSPLVQRRHVDAAAMRLRSSEITVCPSTGGQWYFLGVTRSLDRTDSPDWRNLSTIAESMQKPQSSLASLPFLPGYRTAEELATILSMLELRTVSAESGSPFTSRWASNTAIASTTKGDTVQLERREADQY